MRVRSAVLALAAISCLALCAVPARAVVHIRVDQVGYEPAARKLAIVTGTAGDHPVGFALVNVATGAVVLRGRLTPDGKVYNWQLRLPSGQHTPWLFWTADFSAWRQPGRYVVRVGRTESRRFRIQRDLLERNTVSNIIYYFKGQRATGLFNRADSHLPDPEHPGRFVDLRGGWYDATGDYGIHLSQLNDTSYFDAQQVPLVAWSLLASYRVLAARHDPNFTQYLRRMRDGGLFGADFLVRMKRPHGSFFESIAAPGIHKWARDRRVSNPHWHLVIKTKPTSAGGVLQSPPIGPYTYQVSFRSGGGMAIAALALASTFPPDGHFSPQQYLRAAQSAFAFLQQHNREILNDHTPNILDDYCALMAATELYRATHQARYLRDASRRADHLMARLISRGPYHGYWRANNGVRPFFSPSDAGLPVISLLQYATIASPARRRQVIAAVRRAMGFELWVTDQVNNPFGYARQLVQMGPHGRVRTAFFFPHDTRAAPWWQGEDARIASLAAAARLAAPYFKNDPRFHARLEHYAWDQLHWILGRNPYGICMLNGSGRGAPYMFFRSWQYTSAPGSIINGITAGFAGEDSIAFDIGYAVTGKDDDWRWTEQWLPHAAWFLYAASLPH